MVNVKCRRKAMVVGCMVPHGVWVGHPPSIQRNELHPVPFNSRSIDQKTGRRGDIENALPLLFNTVFKNQTCGQGTREKWNPIDQIETPFALFFLSFKHRQLALGICYLCLCLCLSVSRGRKKREKGGEIDTQPAPLKKKKGGRNERKGKIWRGKGKGKGV